MMDMDYDTLNRILHDDGHGGFSEFYKKHSAKGRKNLRSAQLRHAYRGNAALLIFLGKQYLGQTDNPQGDDDEEFDRILEIRSKPWEPVSDEELKGKPH